VRHAELLKIVFYLKGLQGWVASHKVADKSQTVSIKMPTSVNDPHVDKELVTKYNIDFSKLVDESSKVGVTRITLANLLTSIGRSIDSDLQKYEGELESLKQQGQKEQKSITNHLFYVNPLASNAASTKDMLSLLATHAANSPSTPTSPFSAYKTFKGKNSSVSTDEDTEQLVTVEEFAQEFETGLSVEEMKNIFLINRGRSTTTHTYPLTVEAQEIMSRINDLIDAIFLIEQRYHPDMQLKFIVAVNNRTALKTMQAAATLARQELGNISELYTVAELQPIYQNLLGVLTKVKQDLANPNQALESEVKAEQLSTYVVDECSSPLHASINDDVDWSSVENKPSGKSSNSEVPNYKLMKLVERILNTHQLSEDEYLAAANLPKPRL